MKAIRMAAVCLLTAAGAFAQIAVQGPAPSGSPVSGNPVVVAGTLNNGNTQTIPTGNQAIATVVATAGADGLSNSTAVGGFTSWASAVVAARIAPYAFNGSTWDRQFVCAASAAVNVTNGTTGQLVALASGQTVRICSMVLTSTAATTATLSYGTGTNCGTGNTVITGALALAANTPVAIHLGSDSALRGIASNAVCLAAGATTVTGFITYAKY